MVFTDQQIKDYAFQLEDKGASPQEIEQFVRMAKEQQGSTSVPDEPQSKPEPLFKGPQPTEREALSVLGKSGPLGFVAEQVYKSLPVSPDVRDTATAATTTAFEKLGNVGKFIGDLTPTPLDTFVPEGEPTPGEFGGRIFQAFASDQARSLREQMYTPEAKRGEAPAVSVGSGLAEVASLVPSIVGGSAIAQGIKRAPHAMQRALPYMTGGGRGSTVTGTGLNLPAYFGGGTGVTTGAAITGEGRLPTGEELGTGAAIDLATLGAGRAFQGFKSLFKRSKSLKDMKARMSGVEEPDINVLTNKIKSQDDYGLFKKMVRNAEQLNVDRTAGVKSPFALAGDELNRFRTNLKEAVTSTGAQIGKEVDQLKGTGKQIDTTDLVSSLKEKLNSLNVQVGRNGKLNFADSDIAGLAGDQRMLSDIWEGLTKNGAPKMINARSAVAKYRNLFNKINLNRSTGQITVSEGVAKSMRDQLVKNVSGLSDNLAGLNQRYAELTSLQGDINKLTKQGERGAELTRRLFSNASSTPTALFNRVEDLATRYNIKGGKDIMRKADLAKTAENITQYVPETSLLGRGEQLVRGGTPRLSSIVDTAFGSAVSRAVGSRTKNALDLLEQSFNQPQKQAVQSVLNTLGEGLSGISDTLSPFVKAGAKSSIISPGE